MKILVQKFGGTSVAKLECMKQVREKVLAGLAQGYKVIAVLSARAGDTNKLLALADEWSSTPDRAEADSLVSTGEQVSISLFTMPHKKRQSRHRQLHSLPTFRSRHHSTPQPGPFGQTTGNPPRDNRFFPKEARSSSLYTLRHHPTSVAHFRHLWRTPRSCINGDRNYGTKSLLN